MHKVRIEYEPLYARVTFQFANSVEVLLNGQREVCININEVHVWANRNQKRARDDIIAQHARTIYLNFRVCISEIEIVDFFTRTFSILVESIDIQKVQPHQIPLHANMILGSASSVAVVLGASNREKMLTISGKVVVAKPFN
ncbi:hypothetical protein Pyn_38863 [Prunus yedoensis var. nudiflora]|uniref:Uncharacterized protein n=1 Tax=Prunus yedoensis var. nudiflora TaxID=2094558 RepID=A0A314Y5P0_PRUYE|nr:hypothetical protein Pyn_11941 [Prunus yedoensis var. nudiflora]PQQ17995.1 hypothetical protein Pyn_38863 [Prunus yedoensis var. nudiflora]